jgi:hypothetical protein
MAFKRPNEGFSYYGGAEPVTFEFIGEMMRVRLPYSAEPNLIVKHAQSYVELANRQYKNIAEATHRKHLAERREQARREVLQEEHRQKILADLNRVEL